MTHHQTAEDLMHLDELIETILQEWLNPRHPNAWNGSYVIDDELYDGHDQAARRPLYLVAWVRGDPYDDRTSARRVRRMLRPDEHNDYQVIRARDLCEAFHSDEAVVATRRSPDDRPVAYRTVRSLETLVREHLLEERREANEKIKSASTPEALRLQKEKVAEDAKRREARRRKMDKGFFGIGGRK